MDEQFQTNEYRTGCTQPQKSYNGIIAVLLICVIFLMGLVSVLSYMNIRLFHYLDQASKDSGSSLSFSQGEGQLPANSKADEKISIRLVGMTLQELSIPYQQVYDLPNGLYISHVDAGSSAEKLGISPADVLISFAGTSVSRLDTLQDLYDDQAAGSRVALVVYHNGQYRNLTLTLDSKE